MARLDDTKEILLVASSARGPFYNKKCPGCDKSLIVSSTDNYCPVCTTELPKETKVQVNASATIKKLNRKSTVKCNSCGNPLIVANTGLRKTIVANRLFCSVCGSSDVEFSEETVPPVADVPEIEAPEENTDMLPDDEVEELPDDSDDFLPNQDMPEDFLPSSPENCGTDFIPAEEDQTTEDVSDEVKDRIADVSDSSDITSEDPISVENLEASLLKTPEPTWMFFNNGTPVFKVLKSSVSSEVHPIFETSAFVSTLTSRASEVGTLQAVKEFNGTMVKSNKYIRPSDLEALAFDKMSATVLPKLINCAGLAIEAGIKGIYPDLYTDMKAAFYDELVSRNVHDSDAISIIEAAFSSSGPEVFASIIAKAQEIYNLKTDSFNTLKATIQSSGVVKTSASVQSEAHRSFQKKLVEGSLPIKVQASVKDSTKENLKRLFKK